MESSMRTPFRSSLNFRHASPGRPARPPHRPRLAVEELEGRFLLAVTFLQTNLVADEPGMAATTDPNLVNPWGLALGLNSGLWVADNRTGLGTTYDGAGQPLPAGSPLAVAIPGPPGGTATAAPTGVATNPTAGFVISSGGASGPSTELFATEDGL